MIWRAICRRLLAFLSLPGATPVSAHVAERPTDRAGFVRFLSVLVVSVFAGCTTDPARLNGLSDLELCRGYAVYAAWIMSDARAEQYKREIQRRNLLTPDEWELAGQKRIRKGMSRCALYASWGVPMREDIVSADEEEVRHVYQGGWMMSPSSVYTKNGKIEAWAY
jgi:hypothetical protein